MNKMIIIYKLPSSKTTGYVSAEQRSEHTGKGKGKRGLQIAKSFRGAGYFLTHIVQTWNREHINLV